MVDYIKSLSLDNIGQIIEVGISGINTYRYRHKEKALQNQR